MRDIQIAIQVYFIGIVIATIMACVIRGIQLALGRVELKKKEAAGEGK